MAALEGGWVVGGKYRIIGMLGQGGMADVFLAMRAGLQGFVKLVVVKRLRRNLVEDPELLQMFLDEARLAAKLDHRNIVSTYEIEAEGQDHYIAMEFLDGQPYNLVSSQVRKKHPLPFGAHLRILVEVLDALDYAHQAKDFDGQPLGLVHRDVSPHNVFVSYDGQVKLVDFGIAKALGSSIETKTGVVKGKSSYMAPEQARGDVVDARADLFAVGVMLWEAAVGRRMWKAVPSNVVLLRLSSGDGIPVGEVDSANIPDAAKAIIRRALAPTKEARYASAAELRAALEAVLRTMPDTPPLREIGERVATDFAEARASVKAEVERVVTALREGQDVVPAQLLMHPLTLRPTDSATSSPHGATALSMATVAQPRPPASAKRRRLPIVGVAIALVTFLVTAGSLEIIRGRRARSGESSASSAGPAGAVSTIIPNTAATTAATSATGSESGAVDASAIALPATPRGADAGSRVAPVQAPKRPPALDIRLER